MNLNRLIALTTGITVLCINLMILNSCKHKDNEHELNDEWPETQSLSESEVNMIRDQIRLITAIPPKTGELSYEEHAAKILSLGKRVNPFLVDMITDSTPTDCALWNTVGDMAHMLLCEIYDRDWPSKTFAHDKGLIGSEPYRNYYVRFLKSSDPNVNRVNRESLQAAWRQTVREIN